MTHFADSEGSTKSSTEAAATNVTSSSCDLMELCEDERQESPRSGRLDEERTRPLDDEECSRRTDDERRDTTGAVVAESVAEFVATSSDAIAVNRPK